MGRKAQRERWFFTVIARIAAVSLALVVAIQIFGPWGPAAPAPEPRRLIDAETGPEPAAMVPSPPRRPNIIWVMSDDLGWGEIGLFPSSSPHGRIETPHLDRFGREGMVFRNAYAGYTVCAPSRTSFFTGRHSGTFVKAGLNGMSLPANHEAVNRTLGYLLKGAGYATGLFGKSSPLESPERQGFDVFVGQVDQALCHNMYPRHIDSGRKQLNYPLTGNFQEKSRSLCMAAPERYNYTVDVFHSLAMDWMTSQVASQEAAESAQRARQPFFLYLGYTVPHGGGWADAPKSPMPASPVPSDLQYADKKWPEKEKDHAAMITYMDLKIGDLMRRLESLNIDKDTVVFFASDNGGHVESGHNVAFFDSNGGLKGHKRSLYEGGVRSPSMARWPGTIPAGPAWSDFKWAFCDVLPTLLELAGADEPLPDIDGISIAPTLRGASHQENGDGRALYWTWVGTGIPPTPWAFTATPGYAVVRGEWKGIVPHCSRNDTFEPDSADVMMLYNLAQDPSESKDVSAAHPEEVTSLKNLVSSKGWTCQCYQGPCAGRGFQHAKKKHKRKVVKKKS